MRFTVEHPIGQNGCAPELYSSEGVQSVAQAADRAGFDAIAFTEHPAPARQWVDKDGHFSMDPLAALAFCAPATTNVKLMTHLVDAPYHAALILAKTVATVDRLSGGRLILGMGAGYLQSEFDAVGATFHQRAARFDDTLDVLRQLWVGDEFTYISAFVNADRVVGQPAPLQLPHPPLWIGGNSRAARRRAARSGQGWMALLMDEHVVASAISTPEKLAGVVRELHELLSIEGRETNSIQIQVYSQHSVVYGEQFSSEEHRDHLGRLVDAGVGWFVVRPPKDDLVHCREALAQYREEFDESFPSVE